MYPHSIENTSASQDTIGRPTGLLEHTEDQKTLIAGLIQSFCMWQDQHPQILDTRMRIESQNYGAHLMSVIEEEINILQNMSETSAHIMSSMYRTAKRAVRV